ncbi:MAG: DNA-binding response regulator [Chloroflexi bacterium 44-23]|nr:MAG: DNA-binding response regulator [Chloroflexi bacterium 44-23]
MAKRILVVEDEANIVRTVRLYIEKAGFEVDWATDGTQGLAAFRRNNPTLVLLDLNLPGKLDGLDVCRTLRSESNIPIIMLTARSEETDRLIGLELGADDYITKPFSPREVVARIRTVLRRIEQPDVVLESLEVADIKINLGSRIATISGKPIELTRMEFDLLAALMRSPGRVFSRAHLLEHVLDTPFYEGYERTIDQHVKNLRQKLEPGPRQPKYILTVRGVGYKIVDG